MKSYLILTLSLLVFPFAACNGAEKKKTAAGTEAQTEGKILIVYFSRAGYNYPNTFLTKGNTAVMAEHIQELTDGTLFEIVPTVPYPEDYEQTKTISTAEFENNARPAIKNPLENLDQYSVVFVGYPIWYGTSPMILRTFFDTYDLSGKTIIPFSTHEGSGLGSSVSVIKDAFPKATILEGLAVQGAKAKDARADVSAWLQKVGITKK